MKTENINNIGLTVENIRIPIDAPDEAAFGEAEKIFRRQRSVGKTGNFHIYKKSVDARKKDNITFVVSVYADAEVKTDFDAEALKKAGIKVKSNEKPEFKKGEKAFNGRPVIVGFGPCGMFAAYALASSGYKPVVLERGGSVAERCLAVDRFNKEGILDINTNIQFGAGGAGTFSDGKLTTRIGDPYVSYVLEMFYKMGAPSDILYRAKPHIGTDILRKVVENFNDEIIRLGGEIHYNTKVDEIGEGFVRIGEEKIYSDAIILAVGHSARDTYKDIISKGFDIAAKPFSVGVRIEHLQRDIDIAMHGTDGLVSRLGHAEYNVSHRKGERGVYSFCMCPGGVVAASSSEEFGVVTNGMSEYARDGRNANSALAVSVLPADFDGNPMKAIEFQRSLERAAYEAGGKNYNAPVQTYGDFINGKAETEPEVVLPTYRNGETTVADLNKVLPQFVTSMLKEGIEVFGRRIKGFNSPSALLTGVETRTSAPLRILRGEDRRAIGKTTIYPAGEGAGYAGGIVSAAVDGIRTAEAIMSEFRPPEKQI